MNRELVLFDITGAFHPTEIQSDAYASYKIFSQTGLYSDPNIYPQLIRRNSYVFLGYTNIVKQQATLTVTGAPITYNYPIQFLDQTKSLIYNNSQVHIYR